MTCHNRRQMTLSCLADLYRQSLPENVLLDIYVVDDGSTDGTGESVERKYPQVNLIEGNGDLFWGGGMRLGFGVALRNHYDFYLWINDDIRLQQDAVDRALKALADVASKIGKMPSIAGVFVDSPGGDITYGGWRIKSYLFPSRFERVPIAAEPQLCDTCNGNFTLIPAAVPAAIGNIDDAMQHAMGDFDYLLRAQRAGFSTYTVPGVVGQCADYPDKRKTALEADTIWIAWNKLISVKYLPPRPWARFHRRHGGPLWILSFLSPYLMFWIRALTLRLTSWRRKSP